MAPQLHRNCTSDRPACSFPEPLPQTYTYCQLAGGAPSSRCLRLCFSTLYRKCFPHLRAHQNPHFSTFLSFTKSVVKKSRRRRFVPSDISVSSWHYFVILSHLLLNRRGSAASNKGFTSNGRLVFSPPPPHGDTPSLRISFTSQTPQGSQRLHSTSPFLSMTKTLFFSSRRRSYSREYTILPQRWAGTPQQPTPRSGGMITFRAIANIGHTFSSRYKRKRWTAFSRCAKRRITPA